MLLYIIVIWPHSIVVSTPASHVGHMGSNPVGVTRSRSANVNSQSLGSLLFYIIYSEEKMDWNSIWESIKNFVVTDGWQIVEALLILILGIIVVKIVLKVIRSAFKKSKLEKITQSFLLSVIKYALYLILLIIVLQIMGVPMTSFIAALSAAGLAIGLALQNSLTNLASGIIIVSTKPFKAGDYISVNGVEGTVKNIQILTTTITTVDNKDIILPNSTITSNSVTNYQANSTRRINFRLDVAYSEDIQVVRDTLLRVINSDGRVLSNPAPMVRVDNFGDSGICILATAWVDTEDYWSVYWDINELIISEFNKQKINIPYNQLEVRMRTDTPPAPYRELPKRDEKIRTTKQKSLLENILEGELPDTKSLKKSKKKSQEQKKQKKLAKNKKSQDKSN